MRDARREYRWGTRRQRGGKWLSEGADGCVFTAPHNWPCASPADLPAYNPEDSTVVTKIVKGTDFEAEILEHLAAIRSSYKLPNLPEFIGTCTPKTAGFEGTNKQAFNQHMRNIERTRKRCAIWRRNVTRGAPSKMYVLRKYIATLSGYMNMLRFKKAAESRDQIARIFASQSPALLHTLSVLLKGRPYQIVHYDLHTKNIVLYPVPGKTFNSLDTTTFSIGPADFGRALWRDTRTPLTEEVARHWDEPFIHQFILRKSNRIYWDFQQFSLENRIIHFIAQHPAKPAGKQWIEAWATDPFVLKAVKRSKDPVFLSLQTLVSTLSVSRKWQLLETILERLVRLLQNTDTPTERFLALKQHPTLRSLFEKIKQRSMLPVAYGLYLRNALLAMGADDHDLATAFAARNETSFKKIHPVLHSAFNQYWRMLLGPYEESTAPKPSSSRIFL
jgi:hypothetical protein